jgi:hypothetical protein
MSPAIKYTFGRVGLFVVFFLLLLPVPLNFLVRAMIALVVSAVLSYFLLARWRNEMATVISSASQRRISEKERLRAALAGDEEAAAAGDRAAETTETAEDRPDEDEDRTADGEDPAGKEPSRSPPSRQQTTRSRDISPD